MLLHRRVDRILGVHAIPDKAIHGLIDLGQERRHLRWVLLVAFGDRGGENLILVVDADMQLFPALDFLLPVFLGMLLTLATDLQTGAVDDHADRSLRSTIDLPPDRHRGITSRYRGVIRAGQGQAHQRQNGARETLSLAQGKAKE